jgi:hypothetical protein
MSRDDVILVVRRPLNRNYVYYVFHANATLYWEGEEWNALILNSSKFTYSRSKALILAHNKQKKIHTEYGVREVF